MTTGSVLLHGIIEISSEFGNPSVRARDAPLRLTGLPLTWELSGLWSIRGLSLTFPDKECLHGKEEKNISLLGLESFPPLFWNVIPPSAPGNGEEKGKVTGSY